MNLTAKQKKSLKGQAHHLNPVLQIGKNGFSDKIVNALNDVLELHELVKVKFGDFKDEKSQIVKKLMEETHSHHIGTVGNIAIFFKQNPNPKKQKIKF